MKTFKKLLAAAALLCAASQSHAGWCSFPQPTFSATQSQSGGLFTVDMSLGGISNVCDASDKASLSSVLLPYFSDSNATFSAPKGWSVSVEADNHYFATVLGSSAGVVRFTANDASAYVRSGSVLSGFSFTSAYAAATSPYLTTYSHPGYDFSLGEFSVFDPLNTSIFLYVAGSPDALAALGQPELPFLPAPAVPEPSTWAMMGLGLATIALSTRRARRQGTSARMLLS